MGCINTAPRATECRPYVLGRVTARSTTKAFGHETEGLRVCVFDSVSAAERVEHFLEALANTGKNRCITQRVTGTFGFAERHHKIQKVLRLIALNRHHPFLIIQPE